MKTTNEKIDESLHLYARTAEHCVSIGSLLRSGGIANNPARVRRRARDLALHAIALEQMAAESAEVTEEPENA